MSYKSFIISYKNYTIEIANDSHYTLRSTDNINHYKFEYFYGKTDEDRHYPSSKHGIRIFENDEEINSCIICEYGGGTGIHTHSAVIKEDALYLCCGDKIYSILLPDLTIIWQKRIDPATCFGIYEIMEDFIVHGELEINRINKNGDIQWRFGARDIFVCPDGSSSFILKEDSILLQDWEGHQYYLDLNGNELK
jgi:hypothetical protein